jgi:lycopene cyclase domain-containing protein
MVPLALTFEKKLSFYKQLRFLLPAIVLVGCVFIAFDIYMTKVGVWGFNPKYHLNILFLGLPLEEWLFFIIIPYASIFLHDSFVLYFPKIRIPQTWATGLSLALLATFLFVLTFNIHRTYTAYSLSTGAFTLVLSFFDKHKNIQYFFITFLIILIPFFAVNALLTGSFIDQEVVWYNNAENMGIRIFTIPIEDFVYGFSLILLVLIVRSYFKNYFKRRAS